MQKEKKVQKQQKAQKQRKVQQQQKVQKQQNKFIFFASYKIKKGKLYCKACLFLELSQLLSYKAVKIIRLTSDSQRT